MQDKSQEWSNEDINRYLSIYKEQRYPELTREESRSILENLCQVLEPGSDEYGLAVYELINIYVELPSKEVILRFWQDILTTLPPVEDPSLAGMFLSLTRANMHLFGHHPDYNTAEKDMDHALFQAAQMKNNVWNYPGLLLCLYEENRLIRRMLFVKDTSATRKRSFERSQNQLSNVRFLAAENYELDWKKCLVATLKARGVAGEWGAEESPKSTLVFFQEALGLNREIYQEDQKSQASTREMVYLLFKVADLCRSAYLREESLVYLSELRAFLNENEDRLARVEWHQEMAKTSLLEANINANLARIHNAASKQHEAVNHLEAVFASKNSEDDQHQLVSALKRLEDFQQQLGNSSAVTACRKRIDEMKIPGSDTETTPEDKAIKHQITALISNQIKGVFTILRRQEKVGDDLLLDVEVLVEQVPFLFLEKKFRTIDQFMDRFPENRWLPIWYSFTKKLGREGEEDPPEALMVWVANSSSKLSQCSNSSLH